MMKECLRVDVKWLFGEDADYNEFVQHIIRRDPTISQSTYIAGLIRKGRSERTATSLPEREDNSMPYGRLLQRVCGSKGT